MWSQKLQGSIAMSPLEDENQSKIYLATTRGNCYCINSANGSIIWQYAGDKPIFGTPAAIANVGVIFPTVHNQLICLSDQNGKFLWTFKTDGPIFSSIINYKEMLIFGCHDKNLYVVVPSNETCSLVDQVQCDAEISTTACVYKEYDITVIVAACNAGVIYIIDFNNLLIMKSIRLPNEIFSSPVVFGKKLYVGCRDNYLYCIDLSAYLLDK